MDARFWIWVAFGVSVPTLICLDLLVLYRRFYTMTLRQAFTMVAFWVGVGLSFGSALFLFLGVPMGLDYITAYIAEYSLSMDNIFVFIIIFTILAVPREARYFSLYLGILGAILLRGIFIFGGIEMVEQSRWAFILLGAILLYTTVKIILQKEEEVKPERIWLVRLARRFLRFSDAYEGSKFFVRKEGTLLATPLFLVMAAIAGCDIIFAFDSIPTVLGITQDRLIAFSSNLFAVLGLRALYFVLERLLVQFVYLRYGLALILGFISIKLMLKPFYIEIPTGIVLGLVIVVLAFSVLASILKTRLTYGNRERG